MNLSHKTSIYFESSMVSFPINITICVLVWVALDVGTPFSSDNKQLCSRKLEKLRYCIIFFLRISGLASKAFKYDNICLFNHFICTVFTVANVHIDCINYAWQHYSSSACALTIPHPFNIFSHSHNSQLISSQRIQECVSMISWLWKLAGLLA